MTKPRVDKQDDGTHAYHCEEPGCGFQSFGHATQKQATTRGQEHQTEHETKEPMREIGDFMADQG